MKTSKGMSILIVALIFFASTGITHTRYTGKRTSIGYRNTSNFFCRHL